MSVVIGAGWAYGAAGCVFLALFLGFAAVLVKPGRRSVVDERLSDLEAYRAARTLPPAATGPGGPPVAPTWVRTTAVGALEGLLRRGNRAASIAEDLDRAAIALRPSEWVALRLALGVILVAASALATGNVLVAVPLGALLAWVLTRLWLSLKVSRRCAAFDRQLPDTLQIVASSLRSGFSLAQAVDAVVHDGDQPIAGEFSRALAEARIGIPLEDALDRVASRMRSRDLSWVVMAVRISREVGGNLSEVLMTTVHTVRERSQIKRQVKALSAEGRLSAYVLVAMPVAISAWLFLARPEYVRPLYTTGMGVVMLVVGVAGLLLGGFWLSRVVKVEV